MSLVQVMDIAESLLHLDPVRTYRERGALQVARSVRADGYVLQHDGGMWTSEPRPLGEAPVQLVLRFGREELGTMHLYLVDRQRLAEDEMRVARWAARLYARGLAYVTRLRREGVRKNGESVAKMLERTPLTPRERELVTHLAGGRGTREIADQMGLTVQTINTYLKRIYSKIGVHSRVELLSRLVS